MAARKAADVVVPLFRRGADLDDVPEVTMPDLPSAHETNPWTNPPAVDLRGSRRAGTARIRRGGCASSSNT